MGLGAGRDELQCRHQRVREGEAVGAGPQRAQKCCVGSYIVPYVALAVAALSHLRDVINALVVPIGSTITAIVHVILCCVSHVTCNRMTHESTDFMTWLGLD